MKYFIFFNNSPLPPSYLKDDGSQATSYDEAHLFNSAEEAYSLATESLEETNWVVGERNA